MILELKGDSERTAPKKNFYPYKSKLIKREGDPNAKKSSMY
jgi:hypothetical protein